MTFSGFPGASASVVGTLSGSSLALQLPQNDGTVRQYIFTAASVSSFNMAVAALRGHVNHVNVLAAAGQDHDLDLR